MVETYVQQAIGCVRAERSAAADRREAYDRFRECVDSVPTAPPAAASAPTRTTEATSIGKSGVGNERGDVSSGTDAYQVVRNAFVEHVYPATQQAHETGSEALVDELGADLAATIVSSDGSHLAPIVCEALHAKIDRHCRQIDHLLKTLDREQDELEAVSETVDDIVEWLAETERTSFQTVGSDHLRSIHEAAVSNRERCETLLQDRQAFLNGTTGQGAVAVDHRSLVASLYDGPVEHPVLDTACRLVSLCDDRVDEVRALLSRPE